MIDPSSDDAPGDDIGRTVREELATVLGHPAGTHTPFYELGLTSVQLVRLRGRLEERLGRGIAQTDLFEHPTAAALTTHLRAARERTCAAAIAAGGCGLSITPMARPSTPATITYSRAENRAAPVWRRGPWTA